MVLWVTLYVGFVVALFFVVLQTLALENPGLEFSQGLASC